MTENSDYEESKRLCEAAGIAPFVGASPIGDSSTHQLPNKIMFLDEFNRADEETMAWGLYLITGVKPSRRKRFKWWLRHKWRVIVQFLRRIIKR